VLAVWWTRVVDALKARPIFRAFGISLLFHFFLFFIIEAGHSAGLWKQRALPASVIQKMAANRTAQNQQKKDNEPVVLQFIEVDPAQPVAEPKDARLYSTANTQAANPDTRENSNTPKIQGSQEKVLKTVDVTKIEPKPQPPPPPKTQPKKDTLQPNLKQVADMSEPVGDTKQNTLTPEEKAQKDLTMDRPAQKPQPARPRTLADARAAKGIIEGPKTKQEGSVNRYALESSMDVKSSPFGSYDAQFIAAVQSRWYALLDQREYLGNQSGKVVVEFRLYSDGRIMQLNVSENEVSDTLASLCQRAITDPAPYAKFPADLRRLLGKDFRDVRFTFHYN
jgi:hypothetical protein